MAYSIQVVLANIIPRYAYLFLSDTKYIHKQQTSLDNTICMRSICCTVQIQTLSIRIYVYHVQTYIILSCNMLLNEKNKAKIITQFDKKSYSPPSFGDLFSKFWEFFENPIFAIYCSPPIKNLLPPTLYTIMIKLLNS